MDNVFIMIVHQNENSILGPVPQFGFSIKAEPTTIETVTKLPNQIPNTAGLFLPFGERKQYLQTWSNDINFKVLLTDLGLREIFDGTPEASELLSEWVIALNKFIKENEKALQTGLKSLSQ